MCCIGSHDTADLEKRMGRVESYLDETVAERLDNEVNDDDSDRRGREGVNREVAHRGAEVTVEIHPPRNQVTIPVDDGVDDEKDSHPVGSVSNLQRCTFAFILLPLIWNCSLSPRTPNVERCLLEDPGSQKRVVLIRPSMKAMMIQILT